MNRGGSSNSLDNGNDDIICSSSGSSFTSDEEASIHNLYIAGGHSNKLGSRTAAHSNQPVKIDRYFKSTHYNHPLHNQQNLRQSPGRPVRFSSANYHMPRQLGYIDNSVDPSNYASTSYYSDTTLTANSSQLQSRIPDLVPDSSSISLLPDQQFGQRRNNQIENINSHRSIIRHRRPQQHRAGHSSTNLDENDENAGFIMAVEEEEEEENHANLFGRPESSVQFGSILDSSRGMNTITVRMCSRLVGCRNLLEAIEFIEQNRDLIDNLTRIITLDAPAYRNYEMSNYQIDHSVKESFNPNFWNDREPIVTTADGNCQYHAVSLSLTGSEAYTPEVRLATAVAVIDHREWFDSMLKLIDRGTVLDLVHTISRSYSWGDETTLKAIAVAINRRIFLYTCNIGKKDYEMVKTLSKEELLDAFKEKKYRGGTGIHTYADPLIHVPANNYIMLFHKSEHFIAVLPTCQQLTMFEPYNPIVPVFN